MNRRDFLSAAALAGALPAAWARAGTPSFPRHLTPMQGVAPRAFDCAEAVIEGRLPAGLAGTFYRNGPALFERAGQRYRHWFDGDGLVQAFRFGDGKVSHRARFVGTAKFRAESEAGEFLLPAFGTAIAARRPVRGPDSLNPANTSVIHHGGRLLALWEGGSAHALDAATLDTAGPVSWRDDLAGMPFSAHPKRDLDGTLWNFGTLFDKMVLYRISPAGTLTQHAVFDAPAGAMVHDFAITRRHLVFLLPPLAFDRAALKDGASFSEAMTWNPAGSVSVLIVDKDDFSRRRLIEAPAFSMFHTANAFESGQSIHVDFVRGGDFDRGRQWLNDIMQGTPTIDDPSHPARLTIDLQSGRTTLTARKESVEFPVIDPRHAGQRHRYVHFIAHAGDAPRAAFHNALMRLDTDSGRVEQYSFGRDAYVEEHVLVPRPGATREGDGWLVGAGFDIRRQVGFASVFDARRVADGPLAVARLPYWLPHAFHGHFHAA